MGGLITLAVLALLAHLRRAQNATNATNTTSAGGCDTNCLVCSAANACLLCDFTRSYFLAGASCVTSSVANCAAFDTNGKCVICAAGQVSSPTGCQAVNSNTPNVVNNCTYFGDNPNICIQCAPGYYLKSNNCTSAKSNITNCLTYSSDGVYCVNCASGFNPTPDFTACVATNATQLPNCLKVGFLNCSSCQFGFNVDENLAYFSLALKAAPSTTNTTLLLQSVYAAKVTASSYSFCSNFQLPNCAVAQSLTSCATCNIGYIRTDQGGCIPFPTSAISNCAIYTTATVCGMCAQQYWLQSPSNCMPVTPIANCLNYSTTAQSVCILCSTIYYLRNNLCYPRVASLNIPNCQTVFVDRDMCMTCNYGYVLSIDFTQCLANIFNCNQTTFVNGVLTCIACQNGYYLSGGTCTQGSITNCTVYQNATACLVCQAGNYLVPTLTACQPHTLASYIPCQTFSVSALNYCQQCNPTRVGFVLQNICLPVPTIIPNCTVYAADGSCAVCNSTLTYLSNGQCMPGTVVGCVQYHPTQNQCVNCKIDPSSLTVYVPSAPTPNNQCLIGNQNPYNNCQNISTGPDKACTGCSLNNFQYLFTSPSIRYCMSTASTIFPASPNTANCNLYDYTLNVCLQCLQNGSGQYYVILNGQCIATCPTGMTPQVFVISNVQVQQMFVCQANNFFTPTTFVAQFGLPCTGFITDAVSKWSCIACPVGSVALFDTTVSANNWINYSYLLTTSFSVYFSTRNKVSVFASCLSGTYGQTNSATSTVLLPTTASTKQNTVDLSNCRAVMQIPTTTSYGCVQCKYGFSAVVGIAKGTSSYILDNCQPITACQSDIWINGMAWGPGTTIPYQIDFFLSCLSCSGINNIGTIPTFGMSTSLISGATPNIQASFIGPFGIPGILDTGLSPWQVLSVNWITQTSCQIPGLTHSATFPYYCGAQAVLIDKPIVAYTNGITTTVTNPVCVACLPMYLPTYSTTVLYGVNDCAPISNCLYSNIFNLCEVCASGYALQSSSLYTTCASTTVLNCFMIGPTGACVMCSQGKVVDADGNCASVNPLGCSQSNLGFYTPAANQGLMFEFYMKGAGCTQCDKNNVAVFFSSPQPLCVFSTTISTQNNNLATATKVFIPYCMFYALDANFNLICSTCNANYIPQQNRAACYLPTTPALRFCAIAQNSGQACYRCLTGYYYDATSGSCKAGNIANCLDYLNANTCLNCASGYFVATTLQGTTLCFDASLTNCQNIDQSQSISGTLSCFTCAAGFFSTSGSTYGNFPLKQCVPVPAVPNCVAFATQSTIATSRLNCIQCSASFFLNVTANACLPRTANVSNCVSYAPNQDACTACVVGYFLVGAGMSCVPNPVGINNCVTYQNPSTCLACAVGMYLWQNTCLPVTSQNAVPNCLYYKSYFECSQCQNNFFLFQNTCQVANAASCLTYLNISACATCPSGYGRSQVLNIISCVPLTSTNCDTPDPASLGPNFGCLLCSPGFYKSGGSCVQVANPIPNCKYYASGSACQQCYNGLIVSSDGSNCISAAYLMSLRDANCQSSFLANTCLICAFGYYRRYGLCAACPTNSTSCLQCNPYAPSECLICNVGFAQAANGTCLRNSAPLRNTNTTANVTTNTTQNTTFTPASANRPPAVLWALLAILYVAKFN